MKTGRSPHILDLRTKAAEPTEAQSDITRGTPTGAQEEASEQAGAGHVTGDTEDRSGVGRREEAFPAAPKKKRRLLPRIIKLIVVLIGAAGSLLLEIPLPERLIGIYFVASVVYAIDSQRTFIVALIFLVLVAGASAAGQSVPAQNYAVYAFYFLVIGLVAAIREQISNRSRSDRGNSQL